jgi:hypothetical protein
LYGADIGLTDQLVTNLFEINCSPGMKTGHSCEARIKSKMVPDMYRLLGIKPLKRSNCTSINSWKLLNLSIE